jgi:hypothetical protein
MHEILGSIIIVKKMVDYCDSDVSTVILNIDAASSVKPSTTTYANIDLRLES